MGFLRDERGQTAILTAVSIACLCGMAGFSVDVGTMFRAKRLMQTAADAGALAGLGAKNFGTAQNSAYSATALNGFTNGSNGVTVLVNNPPSSGPHATPLINNLYVEVIVSQAQPTYFMKLFHLSSMNVSARAVAGYGPGNSCIYTLDTSGNDVGLSGGGDLNMPNCGIMVDSASSNALTISNNANLTASSIGIVGSYTGGASGNLNPTPITGIAPASDPLSYLTAPTYNPASCIADPHPTSNATLGPTGGGTICYNGLTISGSGTVNFNPGIYVINGGFSTSGSVVINGTGVMIYLAAPNGSLSMTGGGAVNLTAPTTGTYAGLLFYEDPNDTNTMKVAGSNGSTVTGIFYAANATLTLSGSSGATFYSNIVVSALNVTGSNNLQSYSTVATNTPLVAPRLVE
ncbi:MAG TPA: pilus assembly protein TadG-related protein [Acidobacteriaceae bacterium]|jgi:hypothetical protein|nr:pilus assembly protein TadG-related protein [Acidobacteriaceae bacterium]